MRANHSFVNIMRQAHLQLKSDKKQNKERHGWILVPAKEQLGYYDTVAKALVNDGRVALRSLFDFTVGILQIHGLSFQSVSDSGERETFTADCPYWVIFVSTQRGATDERFLNSICINNNIPVAPRPAASEIIFASFHISTTMADIKKLAIGLTADDTTS
eukprot:TRINITY_DN62406_c0_g1_i3.p1 TRINITY_DN62406_c0_g1~~TRINITY_DN62406_c0_g1_i3.p1  ORF type:complete len:160 (-),score=7.41 TRINITY_DN62406_c0_g1_i3:452-931(-)